MVLYLGSLSTLAVLPLVYQNNNMSTLVAKNIPISRLAREYQPPLFAFANTSGMQYYSGADCRVYFDHVQLEDIDSIGFQLAQNIRPIYGYHSYTFNALQYGTRLVQGYFQKHFTDGNYLPSVLAAVEMARRGNDNAKLYTDKTYSGINNVTAAGATTPGHNALDGATIEDIVARLVSDNTSSPPNPSTYRQIVSRLNARRFPDRTGATALQVQQDKATAALTVDGLFPPRPLNNDFMYNPANSYLRSSGFTLTVDFGDTKITSADFTVSEGKPGYITGGTFRQLHEVHIVAGPNTQMDTEGKPVAELYTFIAKDLL